MAIMRKLEVHEFRIVYIWSDSMKEVQKNKSSILNRLRNKIKIDKIRDIMNFENTVSFNTIFEDAFKVVEDFSTRLLESSECTFRHELLETINHLNKHYAPTKVALEEGMRMFRVRKVINTDEINDTFPFLGLSAEESFVPPRKRVTNMRANVAYHPVLYATNDEMTAYYEVRANKNDILNLCTIETLEKLKIYNFCTRTKGYEAEGISGRLVKKLIIGELISELFSEPVDTGDKTEEYIITQFIAEYVQNIHVFYQRFDIAEKMRVELQNIGSELKYSTYEWVKELQTPYDGIAYNSQFSEGVNYCIFNYDKCKPTDSTLHKVADVLIKTDE